MWCRRKHTTLRCAARSIKPPLRLCSHRLFSATTSCRESQEASLFNTNRLSRVWIPTGGITSGDGKQDEATSHMVKAGFIRQAQSGVFHYLPLAQRAEEHIEQQLKWHLTNVLGASQVSLSSLSTEELWQRSGRIGEKGLAEADHQFLTVRDRKDSHLILAPTHEEEITSLVANNVKSYKDFPLRLFQINRKYRDELRPRYGLLRTKEFIMKDLYTFDISEAAAMKTYDSVRRVYRGFFRSLGLHVVEARASSGDMGGSHSHEFHMLSESGEDTLHICQSCGYAENEEVSSKPSDTRIEDHACPQCENKTIASRNAIEIGHTFHLGTRYTEPLGALVEVPVESPANKQTLGKTSPNYKSQRVPLQMGCHGIGVSRLIGAIASSYADEKGLRWPIKTSPISCLIVFDGNENDVPGLLHIYASLRCMRRWKGVNPFDFSVWLDDRARPLSWKLKDADLVGYPLVIVLGRKWRESGEYEIQCRFDPTLSTSSKDLTYSVGNILNALDADLERTDFAQHGWSVRNKGLFHEQTAARKHPLNTLKALAQSSDRADTTLSHSKDEHPGISGNVSIRKVVTGRDITAPSNSWHSLDSVQQSASPTPVALSREHLLEKIQLLEKLFALQDKEKEIESQGNK